MLNKEAVELGVGDGNYSCRPCMKTFHGKKVYDKHKKMKAHKYNHANYINSMFYQ